MYSYNAWVVKDNWQKIIADSYHDLRTATNFPIEPICLDGLEFSVEVIKERIAANTIPERRGGNFDVVRSDFGEVLSYLVLEQNYSTQFGYKSIRDRELIQLPGRGIDGIGIEAGEKLKLVLTETKVSDQACSPPNVVDRNSDSMRNQHLAHNSEANTCKKIWDTARKTTNRELQNLFLSAAILFETRDFAKLDVVTCCVLVRPRGLHSSDDFGTFKSSPSDYHPGKIRFLVICIPCGNENNIELIIDEWFQRIDRGALYAK